MIFRSLLGQRAGVSYKIKISIIAVKNMLHSVSRTYAADGDEHVGEDDDGDIGWWHNEAKVTTTDRVQFFPRWG